MISITLFVCRVDEARIGALQTPRDPSHQRASSAASRVNPVNYSAQEPSTLLADNLRHCIVVDCETTGLNPETHRITEIAAVRIECGEILDRFHSLVDPQISIPQEITDLTGLTDAHVRGNPPFGDVAGDLMRFLRATSESENGDIPLVGHNVQFDYSFLQHELIRLQIANAEDIDPSLLAAWTPPLVDTAAAARILIPRERVGRYRLANVADFLETTPRPLHRASVDVEATFAVMKALAKLETEQSQRWLLPERE